SGILSLAVDRPGVAVARLSEASGQAFLLCERMEEIRAAVESGHPGAAVVADDAATRGGAVQGDRRFAPCRDGPAGCGRAITRGFIAGACGSCGAGRGRAIDARWRNPCMPAAGASGNRWLIMS